MGSRPDGWWRDRAGAAVRLHGELVRLAASGRAVPPEDAAPDTSAEPAFVMVLEGAARAATARTGVADLAGLADEVRPGQVTVVQAPGSGDDAIVAVVRELAGGRKLAGGPEPDRGRVLVVTADRELRARCVAAGATIAGPGWLLGLFRP